MIERMIEKMTEGEPVSLMKQITFLSLLSMYQEIAESPAILMMTMYNVMKTF